MAEPVYGFSHPDAKSLLRQLGEPGDQQAIPRRQPLIRASGVWMFESSGSITAASGDTPGTGTGNVQWLNPSSGDIEDWQPNGSVITRTVYNEFVTTILTGTRFRGVLDNFGTTWVSSFAGVGATVRFSLDNALTTAEASNAATVDDAQSAYDNESITVYNMLTSTASTYLFEGDSGDFGLCTLREDGNWWIVNMECP